MVLLIAMILKDTANFELRDEVCLQLEPHLSAVIFIPGTYRSSDCLESPVGFGVSENELTFVPQCQGQSGCKN